MVEVGMITDFCIELMFYNGLTNRGTVCIRVSVTTLGTFLPFRRSLLSHCVAAFFCFLFPQLIYLLW